MAPTKKKKKKASAPPPSTTGGGGGGGEGDVSIRPSRRSAAAAAAASSSKKTTAADNPDVQDELMALSAIYAEDAFRMHEDGQGFALLVVPSPGNAEENYVSVVSIDQRSSWDPKHDEGGESRHACMQRPTFLQSAASSRRS